MIHVDKEGNIHEGFTQVVDLEKPRDARYMALTSNLLECWWISGREGLQNLKAYYHRIGLDPEIKLFVDLKKQ